MYDDYSLVLFDGICNFCNASVDFIIKRDPQRRFRFASLQSVLGDQILARRGMTGGVYDSLVLLEDDRVFTHSTAALRIVRQLRFPWPLLYVLIVVPRFLRDAVYSWFARHRYAWFGQMEACAFPNPDLRSRFIG